MYENPMAILKSIRWDPTVFSRISYAKQPFMLDFRLMPWWQDICTVNILSTQKIQRRADMNSQMMMSPSTHKTLQDCDTPTYETVGVVFLRKQMILLLRNPFTLISDFRPILS